MESLANVEMNELNEEELMMVEGGSDFGKVAALTLSIVGTASAGIAAVACGIPAGIAALGTGIATTGSLVTD
ncbi:hypothetical protein Halha_1941 [Halobacteroides halobius DSM 5150]|uniref:Class IIb bacteriocin, lactobin A/cerein 7B family n=1 Tax=Halobacteroides halobius (strain ATCC 35273 / DSM 5150 / MD-1) TaxID=748449 RepID=L0KBE1_HALHC|nr:hypothetical protein [Halobacteroides halobius]AGB41850.1 hypothetical protein Halha_1941 [Halobacteroides halobius DSM 5150]